MAATDSSFRPTRDLTRENEDEHELDDTFRTRDGTRRYDTAEREELELAPGRRALTQYLTSSHGNGRALPTSLVSSLGPRLSDALDDVRIYDDARAQKMVRAVGAVGFTYGRKIYLSGDANVDTLAHEAAHAAQHRGPAPTGPVRFGGSDRSEDFADRA